MAILHPVPIAANKIVWFSGLVVSLSALVTNGFPIRVGYQDSSLELRDDLIDKPILQPISTNAYDWKPQVQSAALWFHGNGKKSDPNLEALSHDRFLRSQMESDRNKVSFLPPIWFHITRKANTDTQEEQHAARNVQQQLTPKDNQLINDLYQQAIQR